MASEKSSYYTGPQAADFTVAEDPYALFSTWYDDAQANEPNDPNAMALATVDQEGMPNLRMVLMKGLDDAGQTSRGIVFYTNFDSAKGRELQSAGKAALCFHWKSLRRQVRFRGTVAPVPAAEADAYFASRSRGSRIGAWASRQSRPLEGRRDLELSVAKFAAKFHVGSIPRPPHWSGFRLIPVEIEFWHDRPFRLHDRVVFRRSNEAEPWTRTGLFP